jgi:hypothetical protein
MANASSEETVESRYTDTGSSLGSALLLRAAAFVVGCFVAAFLITVIFNDDGMTGVVVGIFLSLSALGFLGTLLAVVASVVKRWRRG